MRFSDERRRFVSSARVFGMPGPVWTLALWGFVEFLVFAGSVVMAPPGWTSDLIALIVGAVYMLGMIISLLVMKDRTPSWYLHAQVAAILLLTMTLVHTSINDLDRVNSSFALFGVTIYSSYWFTRRATFLYVGAGSLVYLVIITVDGVLGSLFLSWLTIVLACMTIGYTFSTVVLNLHRTAVTDKLTGLLDRNGLQMFIDLQSTGGRTSFPRAIVVVDLDGFKGLNDTQGHLAGDALLRRLGQTWRETMRADDYAFRTGGDEFVFVLMQSSAQNTSEFVDRLKRVSNWEWSHGVADWPSGEDFDEALKRADAVLYKDKAARKAAARAAGIVSARDEAPVAPHLLSGMHDAGRHPEPA